VRRLVLRFYAERYLTLLLISFALTIAFTRLFLEISGYPQIGGSTLHIAHAIWGGLLLYAAALLPLILANRWALYLSAGLNGLGAGLFIDEVGKFITRDLDYFYPPAAPLVYAFFLLSVLLYQYVRRLKREAPRTLLYHAFEELQEVLDSDLDQGEYEEIMGWLRSARRAESAHLGKLADVLESYLRDPATPVYPVKPTRWNRFMAALEHWGRRLSPRLHRALVMLLMALIAVVATAGTVRLLWTALQPGPFREALSSVFQAEGDLQDLTDVGWRLLRLGLEGAVGLVAFIALIHMVLRRDDLGARLGVFSLILSLTTVNVLNFYLDQFSATITALFEFGALLVILAYRAWRLRPQHSIPRNYI